MFDIVGVLHSFLDVTLSNSQSFVAVPSISYDEVNTIGHEVYV